MAEAAATYIGIMGVVGVLDVGIKAFTNVYSVLRAPGELGKDVGRVLDICKQVRELAENNQDLQLPEYVANNLKSSLVVVSRFAVKYEEATRRERVIHMPKARSRLKKLSVVERQMMTVLALINARLSGATSAKLNVIATDMLKLNRDLSSDLDSLQTGVDAANAKLDDLLRIPENFPRETLDVRGRTDEWKYSDSTVPNERDFMLGVDDLSVVRELKEMVLNREGPRVAALGVQGSGGVGKTTACTIVARDPAVRERYKDASVWIQLGDDASAMTVVEQVAHIVRETGGHVCATEIEGTGDKDLDEVRKKARGWFSGRSILLVVDNVFPTTSTLVRGGNWMIILQEIPSANSCVLFSTRSPDIARLSDKTVKFAPLTSFMEQKNLLWRHLGLGDNANGISNDEVLELLSICGGVPLALATVASYLRSDHNNFRTALDALQKSFLNEKEQAMVLGGHPGLFAIFGAVLIRLDEDKEKFLRFNADEKLLTAKLPYSWRELYSSLCVLDKSSPRVPVCILSGLWGLEVVLTELVCRCFANLGLGALVYADRGSLLEFQVHDLQRSYCVIESRHSSVPYNSLATWHARLLEGLVGRTLETNSFVTPPKELDLPASSSRTARYVDAFCAIPGGSEEHWFEQYWLDHFVRHVLGIDDGVDAAIDAVTDYRWLRRVAERRSPVDVARSIERLLAADEADVERLDEGGSSSGAARGASRGLSAMNEQDVIELEVIAHVFRWEIPPETPKPHPNSLITASEECAVHPGQWSVGEPGLAHRIIGRLGYLRGGGGAVEAATAGSSEAGRIGVTDALVASVKKYARGPWLCPRHPCFVGLDGNGLERIIRRPKVDCCLAYSHGGEDCAALGCEDGNIYLHRLDSGEEVGVLHADEEGEPIWSMTVSSGGASVSDRVDARWLVVGHGAGIVRIWDVEGARCIARLHASVGVSYLRGIWISRDGGRIVAGDVDNHFLHVWDISPEGEQKKYGRVEVPGDEWTRREILSQFAAAAALCGESRPLDECSNAVTRLRRIRRIRSATVSTEQEGLQRIRRHESGSSACGCLGNPWRRLRRSRREILVGLEQDGREMSVSTENDFIRDNGDRVRCALVQGCDARALLAAVDKYHGGITVMDALTGETLSESPPFWQGDEDESNPIKYLLRVSASQVDGRTLVATCHVDWMVRVRSADSGELIGQWQGPSHVYEVYLDAASRRVLSRDDDEVIVWSFARAASEQHGEATAQLRNNARPSHSIRNHLMRLVGFFPDGQTAVSWDYSNKDLIVWDAATGNSVYRVKVDGPPLAVSSSADWTLVVGNEFREGTNAHFTLFDPSGEKRSSGTFHCYDDWEGECSAAFTPDGRGCTVAVEDPEKDTKEVHEFTISDAGEMTELRNGTAPNALPPSACLEANPAKQLTLEHGYRVLLVRRSGRRDQTRCTCAAVAYFDSSLQSSCSWSNVGVPDGSSEHNNSSTVAVGRQDGAVHFMAFLEE